MSSRLCAAYLLASLLLPSGIVVAADKHYTIAVIPKGTTHEFWKSVNAGAVKAGQELQNQGYRVDLIWKGPLREDDRDQQIQVVENFMTRRVSGMVLAPLDSQALAAPVASAVRANIPVVIIDSGLKSDKQVSFVATDNFKGGQMAAAHLGSALQGKGKVVLLRYAVGSASTEEREAGFLETMKSKFPGIALVSTDQHAGTTREGALAAAQNILNRYGRETDGIFCPCEPVTSGVLMALKNIGKAGGKIKVVGFDAGAGMVEALKKGDVEALVLQDPINIGYLGVKALVDHLDGKKVERRIDTGVRLVTRANMEEQSVKELLHPPLDRYLK